jgi:hypothetical protein
MPWSKTENRTSGSFWRNLCLKNLLADNHLLGVELHAKVKEEKKGDWGGKV